MTRVHVLSLLCLVLLMGAVTCHKHKLKKLPQAPRQFIILQAGPSVTYPWVGHGKVHKAPYFPRPLFPSFAQAAPAPAAPVYQAVASYPAAPVSYAPDVPQYPSEPEYPSSVPVPSYAGSAAEYAPAAPEYAPAAPTEYVPDVPSYAVASPEYAAAPSVPQYDPLPAPVYAEDVAAQPYAAPEGFPSFNDIAPSDVIVEPIISYDDAGFSSFDGPEPRPLEEEPIGWGTPEEEGAYGAAAEESYAQAEVGDAAQEYEEYEAPQESRYAEPAQDVAVAFDEAPVYGESPEAGAQAPETYAEAPEVEEPEYDAAVAESKSFGVRLSPRAVNFRA